MPVKKPSKKPPSANPDFRGFININLTDEDKSSIKSITYEPSDAFMDLDRLSDDGFKLTFSYDDYNRCYQVIAARKDRDNPDYGIMLAARGSTALKALRQWMYIQDRLIGESTWTDMLSPVNRYDLDD